MEKLIELLNEYHHFNSDLIYYGWDEKYKRIYFHTELPEEQKKKLGDALFNDGINEQRVGDEWICSKKFGFIKWLVENDKIDRDNARLRKSLWETDTSDIDKIIYTIKNSDYHYVMREAPYEAEETLLMLLSISDTPIEDLLLYLK